MVSWRTLPTQRQRIAARPLDKEHPDKTPVSMPVGFETPPTMTELIQQYVRHEVSQAASANDQGTFEEEDDFSLDEHYPLPFEKFDVNEYSMSDDPEMPPITDPDNPTEVTAPAAPVDPPAAPVAAPAGEATDPPVPK